MILGNHWESTQWIEYHRIIGFQHFPIYLDEPYEPETLPNAADITYIPGTLRHWVIRGLSHIKRCNKWIAFNEHKLEMSTWLALH
jgi:hypothetical protein